MALLRPGGTLLLIEGHWSTGAGITALRCRELLDGNDSEVIPVSSNEALGGGRVPDERYLIVSHP